jgi:hypothetical protein
MKVLSTISRTAVFTLIVICTIAVLGLTNTAFAQSAASVATDKADYPPGGTVVITGAGWAAGEPVRLQVLHDREVGDNELSGAHAPWEIVADANGTLSTTWNVPLDEDELGATLRLNAAGLTSGLAADLPPEN